METTGHAVFNHQRGDPPRLGVIFPQKDFHQGPVELRRFATAIDRAGFDHVVAYDHVLGAATATRPAWRGAYSSDDPFIEPFLLFSYLTAFAPSLEYATGVLVLPQRQAALVAKQAATLDYLTGGRFRLGVGVGWNEVEYQALNESFRTRGKRLEEQIDLIRHLTSHEVIDYTGEWHRVDHAGIRPLGPQRPVPIWIGASADVAIARAARLADGFFVTGTGIDTIEPVLATLRDALLREDRDRTTFGVEVRISLASDDQDRWKREMAHWRAAGVSHLSFVTLNGGFTEIGQHIERFLIAKRIWDEL